MYEARAPPRLVVEVASVVDGHADTVLLGRSDQLRRNLAKKEDKYSINVDINDLAAFDEGLAAQLRDAPRDTLPLVTRPRATLAPSPAPARARARPCARARGSR